MKLTKIDKKIETLAPTIKSWLDSNKGRLGLLTSVDGKQLALLMLDPTNGKAEYWEAPITNNSYRSLTATLPQTHWYERLNWDLFGIVADQHPRLKHIRIHDTYPEGFYPLRKEPLTETDKVSTDRHYEFLEVKGEGIYELPVGPIHAGIIEPGHFRFSCLGETIVNLELRLGWVHRGVEKRLTEVPWTKARFVAEAAASDTACANALAHAIAIESLADIQAPQRAQYLRTLALELERAAMHIIDIGGIGTDTGFLAISGNMSRLRGVALEMAHTISGSRFLRAFIMPGGVRNVTDAQLKNIKETNKKLRGALEPVVNLLNENQAVIERCDGIGRISRSLANEFGLVGVAARAAGIAYDTRQHFPQGIYPKFAPPVSLQTSGDILGRTRVRIGELWSSLDVIDQVLADLPEGPLQEKMPEKLQPNQVATGIVEAFRGELIHLVFTDEEGKIKRYAIKDPSVNNWTTISIAIRNNLLADFPLCNKSLALSYSGNDL